MQKAIGKKSSPHLIASPMLRARTTRAILADHLTFGQTMRPTFIEMQNLTVGKGNQIILHDLNWELRLGQHWYVSGATGTGKTTLLEAIQGKARKFSGQLKYPIWANVASEMSMPLSMALVSFTDTGKLFRSVNAVHYYQQRYNAFDSDGHLTVLDYLLDGGFNQKNGEHLKLAEQFGLSTLLDTERIKLSSGQTRKLLLCKAFLKKPTVLLLDNPHIGLDDQSRDQFNNLVDQIAHQYSVTFVLAGQLKSLPRCISHRLSLGNGTIQEQGAIQTYTSFDEQAQLDSGQKYALDKIKFYFLNNRNTEVARHIIQFKQVNISYGGQDIIQPVNWQVKRGEKWSLVGGNGSGKSTLVGLIYGDHPQAYRNHIRLFGRRRGYGESIWDIKQKMGFTSPELHAYFPLELTVQEVIASGFSDTLYPKRLSAQQLDLITIFLSYFNCADLMNRAWTHLSTGEQRLALFIRAMVKAPPLLLLDEPFQGFDSTKILLARHLLNEVLTKHHAMVFITHFRDEIPLNVTNELNL